MGRLIAGAIRFLVRLVIYTITAVFIVLAIEYLLCPIYNFPDPKPFTGNKLFNPYQAIDDPQWKTANFQVQSYSWLGITDGRKNSNRAIDSVYNYMGYDIRAISDYQKISKYGNERDSYIRVYEHGYGIWKNHQVLLGASRVLWTDYPIFQTLHHKQHILNLLRQDNKLVYIAHPRMRGGYSPDDMRYLGNYDGQEVLNGFGNSPDHWDAALSAGKMVTILGNDDAHNVFRPDDVGNLCTMIHSPSLKGEDVLSALKKGQSYGVDFRVPGKHSYEVKRQRVLNVPELEKARLFGDTLVIMVNRIPLEVRFIGQEGVIKKTVEGSDSAGYVFDKQDTYIRTEISFENGTVFYLNPVIRFDGSDPWKMEKARIAPLPTWILRITGFSVLLALFVLFIRRRINK
jgi:hypothetical protein